MPEFYAPPPILDSLGQLRDGLGADRPLPAHLIADPRLVVVSDMAADYRIAAKFLVAYDGSSATFNAYRREIERLLQWSWRVESRSVCRLAREDIERFIRFAVRPPVAWVGDRNVARFLIRGGETVPNPHWRPFVATVSKIEVRNGSRADRTHYEASQASVRATFAVLSSFYDFLLEEGLVDVNPVALIRQRSKFLRIQHNAPVVRRITRLQWEFVLDTANAMADRDPERHERTLFVMHALFAMYLRISELVADERSCPLMGDFRKDQDQNWWFHVTGKGNKDRTIVVSENMLSALKRYRLSRGLSPLPSPNDPAPLLTKAKGRGPLTSTRQVRRLVQECFDAAFERMKAHGLECDADDLQAATVHWLRHTGISEDVKLRPREHVRDDAGHATMATTDRYVESDRRERHASGKRKPLRE
ncbi:site-specific integrase [Maricaulis sp.]|uniref:tyrosine-type recombinase/integrase n=1 Tax=Maricaulis sp. TaxID=1486257 RepID=UPI0032979B2C